MLSKKDIALLKEIFTTKDDLKSFATKDDLKSFATKNDLKSFTEEINNNMRGMADELIEYISIQNDALKKEIRDTFAPLLTLHHSTLEDHEDRIAKVEKKLRSN